MAVQHNVSLRLSGSKLRYPHGKFPAVAINDAEIVVEMHQPSRASNEIHYQVGNLNGDLLDLSEPRKLDTGSFPKVAINNDNQVVEVHEGHRLRYIYYSIGKIEVPDRGRRINCQWNVKSRPIDWGRYPAIAIHGNRVVITYDRSYLTYTTYYCIGTINDNGTDIVFGVTSKLFDAGGAETSVAMNAEHVVAVGRGWNGFICMVAQIRAVQGGQIEAGAPGVELGVKTETTLDIGGFCPNVCLTAADDIVMVWQTSTLRQLKYSTGRINFIGNGAERQIDGIHINEGRGYDMGCNPTIAVSLNGQHVLEEHETNAPNGHSNLYYRTGIIEIQNKPPVERDHENEQDGQNGN